MEKIKILRTRYPAGTKIRLIEMDDSQAPPAGTVGTVKCVDDMGTIHVRWETGSNLGLIPEEDRFELIKEA